jgi:heptosyltransferase-2
VQKISPLKYDKLLVLLPNWIGDAVMATPLLVKLRKALKDTKIILTGPPHIVSLFSQNSLADKIIAIKDIKKESSIPLAGKALDIWKKSEIYEKEDVQRVLLIPGSLSSAITARLSKIPVRLGYGREGRKILLTSSIDHPKEFRNSHRVHYFLNLLKLFPEFKDFEATFENTPQSDPLTLDTTDAANDWASQFLKDNNVTGKILAIHGGGAYGPSKRWAADSFISTLTKAAESRNFTVLITGSNEDVANGKYIEEALVNRGIKTLLAAGVTPTVGELAALLKQSSLFLSNDSGPMHIAAAFKIPQVAIFTSTSTVFTKPWNSNAYTFSSNLDCSPCFKKGCPLLKTTDGQFNDSFPCHKSISIKAVSDKLIELL